MQPNDGSYPLLISSRKGKHYFIIQPYKPQ